MDKSVIKRVLGDFRREVPRYEIFPRAIDVTDYGNHVFVGVRRAGKSFLLFQCMQQMHAQGVSWNDMIYVNFEDERLDGLTARELNQILEVHYESNEHRPVLFLDEIQNVEGWDKFARRLADAKYTLYITGSNAKMLSEDVATTLGGRFFITEVFPYSFREYLSANKLTHMLSDTESTEGHAAMVRTFSEFFRWGGMPECASFPSKRSYLQNIYQKIYLGDIVTRNGFDNAFGLRIMLRKMAESVKQPLSFTRIANIISSTGSKLSKTSVIKYVLASESSWLILPMTNIAAKLADRESNRKYYFIDNGILNLLLLDADTSLLENLVAINLMRRYGSQDAVYFYNKNVEVDFYVPEDEWAIQVCYDLNDEATHERECSALINLRKVLPCRRLSILTYNTESVETYADATIEILPVWKWLLDII